TRYQEYVASVSSPYTPAPLVNVDDALPPFSFNKDLLDQIKILEVSPERVTEMCYDYLTMMGWVLRYYMGKPRNEFGFYKYPYPPLIVDLAVVLGFFREIVGYQETLYKNIQYGQLQGLLNTMPVYSMQLVPAEM